MLTQQPSHHDTEEYRFTELRVAELPDCAADELYAQFSGIFGIETIRTLVEESYTRLSATAGCTPT